MRACASGWSQRYPGRGECPMLGRESRSISHNHDDGDDNDCGDQRKRTIECFRARPCEGHFERRHDMAPSVHLLPRPASFCRNQPLTIGRSAQQARLLECLGPLRPGRYLTRFLEGVHRPRAFDGDYRPRSCFPAFRPWFLLGRLEFAAKPLANAGFHWVLRYGRGLNTTAPLALKCSAVEASGSRLDLGEKHSLVIARRAARPLNRREVGRGDRLIFAYGASLRWERYELPVTDNWSILLIFHNLCLAGLGRDARRWRRPKHGVGRRLTGYTPRRAH